ncbi:MAG: hypothetical protein IJI71_09645, partial [Clostridia bacterium]|nr:hypothetical protein [Clostridia bacterium]
SDEVGPPAVTMIYSHPSKRTTSSVTALRAAPPSPESAASLPGEGFGDRRQQPDKSVFTAFHLSVAATIRRHRCFLDTGGGRLPPLHVVGCCI